MGSTDEGNILARYQSVVLTVIAFLLAAIVFKLYGPRAMVDRAPTRTEVTEAKKLNDPAARKAALKALADRVPVVWVVGGDVDVSGSVGLDGPVVIESGNVTVDGEVSVENLRY